MAQQLGMTVSRERRSALPPDSAVYLTGMDYIPTIERAQGADYDPEAWLSMLLCQFTREEHLRATGTRDVVTTGSRRRSAESSSSYDGATACSRWSSRS